MPWVTTNFSDFVELAFYGGWTSVFFCCTAVGLWSLGLVDDRWVVKKQSVGEKEDEPTDPLVYVSKTSWFHYCSVGLEWVNRMIKQWNNQTNTQVPSSRVMLRSLVHCACTWPLLLGWKYHITLCQTNTNEDFRLFFLVQRFIVLILVIQIILRIIEMQII